MASTSAVPHDPTPPTTADPDLEHTLGAVLCCAVEAIDGIGAAGLDLLADGRLVALAAYGDAARRLAPGAARPAGSPALHAARTGTVVAVTDLSGSGRWSEFAAAAGALGVDAVLSAPLAVDQLRIGSLSWYGRRTCAFGPDDLRAATLLAAHAATAVVAARRNESLRRAIENRDLIGQAKGILMERHRVTADVAFEMLARASQRTNRKLWLVAEELSSTGQLARPA